MEQLRRLQALVMNTSNKPAQTGTCVLVRTEHIIHCTSNEQQLLNLPSVQKTKKNPEVEKLMKTEFLLIRWNGMHNLPHEHGFTI